MYTFAQFSKLTDKQKRDVWDKRCTTHPVIFDDVSHGPFVCSKFGSIDLFEYIPQNRRIQDYYFLQLPKPLTGTTIELTENMMVLFVNYYHDLLYNTSENWKMVEDRYACSVVMVLDLESRQVLKRVYFREFIENGLLCETKSGQMKLLMTNVSQPYFFNQVYSVSLISI